MPVRTVVGKTYQSGVDVPVSPDIAEDLSAGVKNLYADAEQRLLRIIARQLGAGLEAPGWAVNKLADISALRRAARPSSTSWARPPPLRCST